MDVFKWKSAGGTTSPEPSNFVNSDSVLVKSHFAALKVFQSTGEIEVLYQPIQARHHCFKYKIFFKFWQPLQ